MTRLRSALVGIAAAALAGCAPQSVAPLPSEPPAPSEGRGLCRYEGIGPVYCVHVEWRDGRAFDCMYNDQGGMWCVPVGSEAESR